MTNEELRPILIKLLWDVDLAITLSMYAPDDSVITISNILYLLKESEHEVSKYRLRLTLKELIADGVVEYKSVGCPGEDTPCFEYSGPVLENIDGYVSKDDLYKLISKLESQLILNTAQATVLWERIKELPGVTNVE